MRIIDLSQEKIMEMRYKCSVCFSRNTFYTQGKLVKCEKFPRHFLREKIDVISLLIFFFLKRQHSCLLNKIDFMR